MQKTCVVCGKDLQQKKGNFKTCEGECREIRARIKRKLRDRKPKAKQKAKTRREKIKADPILNEKMRSYMKIRNRELYLADRESRLAKAKQYAKDNPDVVRKAKASFQKRKAIAETFGF